MDLIRVNSSAILSVGYDVNSRRMKIQFQQGHSYDFCNVPQNIYDGLMRAASKGVYYNDNIKDRFQC
jgi:hypothetical protein